MSTGRRVGEFRSVLLVGAVALLGQAVGCLGAPSAGRPEQIAVQQSALTETQLTAHSGTRFHGSASYPGFHQHYFNADTPSLAISTIPPTPAVFGPLDSIYAYVYLDASDLPSEVMLQFMDETGSWEHRAFWGPDNIAGGAPGTGAHHQMCSFPVSLTACLNTGSWQRLIVPASAVDMVGHRAVGAAYSLFGGKAYWDDLGYLANGSVFAQHNWVDDVTPPGTSTFQSWDGGWYWLANKRNWLQFGGDSTHAGNNPLETQISASNMAGLQHMQGFTAYTSSFPTEAPPVLLKNVNIAGTGVRDALFVNSRGNLYALDAYTGAKVLAYSFIGSGSGGEASPAIDPSLLSVYNVGRDHKIHKYDIASGVESGTGWDLPGTATEACKTAITIGTVGGTSYLYVGTANGSGGVGHLVTINLTTGAQSASLLTNAGMWQRAGLSFDPVTQRLYAATGDAGPAAPWNPTFNVWSLSVLGVSPDGTAVVDSYTPKAVASLEAGDMDLSSSNTLILPVTGTYRNYTHLAAQSGKDGYMRLINLDNMSGKGGPMNLGGEVSASNLPTLPSTPGCIEMEDGPCPVRSPIATWVNPADNKNWVFVNGTSGMNAMKVLESRLMTYLFPVWKAPTVVGKEGGSFVANGVLYYANGSGLHWVDATTGLDPTGAFPVGGTGTPGHQTPVVINGVLYYNGDAFSLGGVSPAATNLALRKQGTQSSNLPGYSAFASLATDGNTDGNFWNASVIHTNNEPESFGLPGNGGPWWEVNLGSNFNIKKVVIFNRTDAGQSRLSSFRLAAFNFSVGAWHVLYTQTTPAGPVISIDVNETAQLVLLQRMCGTAACGTADDYLNFAEVQVF